MSEGKTAFPILCETCLGENPFIRMTREKYGDSCKICNRPYNVYRWRPGAKARFKRTMICQTCAKLKDVCQTCILDLQFNLPVQVRDKALSDAAKIDVPLSVVNRDFQFTEYEKQLEENGAGAAIIPGSISKKPYAQVSSSAVLAGFSRNTKYFKRNLPKVCSFFERGTCTREMRCPYRHELDDHDEAMKKQNVKDRFYGVNDPVALKILRSKRGTTTYEGNLEAPEDVTITSIFLGGIDENVTEDNIREELRKYGEISNVTLLPLKACGFVKFSTRSEAETAVKGLKGSLVINNTNLKVGWSKTSNKSVPMDKFNDDFLPPPGMDSLPKSYTDPATGKNVSMPKVPVLMVPPRPGKTASQYPSMDPSNYAANFANSNAPNGRE